MRGEGEWKKGIRGYKEEQRIYYYVLDQSRMRGEMVSL
jgi:hypothetical protein